MNEELRTLIRLQKLDTRLIEKGKAVKTIPLRIKEMDPPIQAAEEALAAQKAAQDAIEKKRKLKEAEVKEIKERINKMRERTAQIKDNKAYTAHLAEIEAAEKSIHTVEDGILEIMEQVEAETPKVKAAEAALKEQKDRAAQLKKHLEAEVAEAQKELDQLKIERDEMTRSVDKALMAKYMELLKATGGHAVVAVESEICGGCMMNIMPQLFLQIKANDKIITCPQCKRIMYYEDGNI